MSARTKQILQGSSLRGEFMRGSFYWAIRRRFLPLLWRNSLWAYRQYQLDARSLWLRRVFDELVNREDIWSGQTKLRGLSSLHLFDSALSADDRASAEKIARAMIEGFADPLQQGASRVALAARALLVHDNLALCDRLLLEHRQGEDPTDVEVERVLLTLSHEGAADLNRQLIGKFLRAGYTPIGLVKAWTRSCWLYEGPSQELLQEIFSFGEKARKHHATIMREALALAFLLNDSSMVRRLLTSYPELEQSYDRVLPLAAYLTSSGASSRLAPDRARISEFAELYAKLNDGTISLMDLLRDKNRSIAIVGNSPCEIGSGKGPWVDGHDLVARFNLFSISEKFACDYGRKCSIHVRLPEDENMNHELLASDWTVINRPDLIYRHRNWKNALALSIAGARLCSLPTGFHQALYRTLRAEPSAGITFCALVKAVRGHLPRRSCFGFSFVDQTGKSPTSAHYFRDARPSFKHHWAREKAMLEELTAVSSPNLTKESLRGSKLNDGEGL